MNWMEVCQELVAGRTKEADKCIQVHLVSPTLRHAFNEGFFPPSFPYPTPNQKHKKNHQASLDRHLRRELGIEIYCMILLETFFPSSLYIVHIYLRGQIRTLSFLEALNLPPFRLIVSIHAFSKGSFLGSCGGDKQGLFRCSTWISISQGTPCNMKHGGNWNDF